MSDWPKIMFIAGWVLVVSGFCVGVQPTAASSHGREYGCAAVIPTSWLVAGAPSSSPISSDSSRGDQRRAAAACHSPVVRAQLSTWGMLGVGGLVVLAGATALREREPSGDRLVAAAA